MCVFALGLCFSVCVCVGDAPHELCVIECNDESGVLLLLYCVCVCMYVCVCVFMLRSVILLLALALASGLLDRAQC